MSEEPASKDPPQSSYLAVFIVAFGLLVITMFKWPLW